MKRWHYLVLIILGVLVVDQWLKVYVKTSFSVGGGFDILGLSWAKIHFIENKGMAFGISFGDKCLGWNSDGQCVGLMITPTAGKLILSIFRIAMVGFLIYLLRELYRAGEKLGILISLSLILAGAIGNIIDSTFYGLIFSQSYVHSPEVAQLFPSGGGYAPILQGWVVDMLYFPLIDTILPQWIPFVGGQRFEFFRPIFNVADASISVGVAIILLFYRSFLLGSKEKKSSIGDSKVLEAANPSDSSSEVNLDQV